MGDRLQGKVALITGAASGIGAATAVLFAREGATLALTDVAQDSLEPLMAQVTSAGTHALAMGGDVTRRSDTERIVDETLKRHGRIDALVNSAGVAPRNAPPEWDWEQVWDFVMAVNMKGTFLMCRAVADRMVKQGGGSIVNLSSIYGLVGRPRELGNGLDPYLHSKGGVAQLTRDMAVHFARDGVRVNALCPGFVFTPLTRRLTDDPGSLQFLVDRHPMGRLGQPAEIAAAALFLASDDASFITGVCLPVDGGYTAQ
jgi:NAD(P)-dependent dehydrogenase (short-subunit alcohol dehydrogenase family)